MSVYAGRWRDCCPSGENEAHVDDCHLVRQERLDEQMDAMREVIRSELAAERRAYWWGVAWGAVGVLAGIGIIWAMLR